MDWDEIHNFLVTVGMVEGKIDGIFIGIFPPSDPPDETEGFKLLIDHENITENSYKLILDKAKKRGKYNKKIIRADREMTIIFTPRARDE